jgi:hypothetical protein
MHSRATDRRSASKCQGKWQIRPSDQALGLPEVLVAVSTSRLSCGGAYGGDGGRKPGLGRMANAKSIGWAIYAVGFVIWLFGYVTAGHASVFDWEGPRRGGFLVSFPISKQNLDLRSCSRA